MPGPGQVSILACQVTHIAQVAPGFTASVHHSTGFMLCKRVEGSSVGAMCRLPGESAAYPVVARLAAPLLSSPAG